MEPFFLLKKRNCQDFGSFQVLAWNRSDPKLLTCLLGIEVDIECRLTFNRKRLQSFAARFALWGLGCCTQHRRSGEAGAAHRGPRPSDGAKDFGNSRFRDSGADGALQHSLVRVWDSQSRLLMVWAD